MSRALISISWLRFAFHGAPFYDRYQARSEGHGKGVLVGAFSGESVLARWVR
jgi:hypothetical protein